MWPGTEQVIKTQLAAMTPDQLRVYLATQYKSLIQASESQPERDRGLLRGVAARPIALQALRTPRVFQ